MSFSAARRDESADGCCGIKSRQMPGFLPAWHSLWKPYGTAALSTHIVGRSRISRQAPFSPAGSHPTAARPRGGGAGGARQARLDRRNTRRRRPRRRPRPRRGRCRARGALAAPAPHPSEPAARARRQRARPRPRRTYARAGRAGGGGRVSASRRRRAARAGQRGLLATSRRRRHRCEMASTHRTRSTGPNSYSARGSAAASAARYSSSPAPSGSAMSTSAANDFRAGKLRAAWTSRTCAPEQPASSAAVPSPWWTCGRGGRGRGEARASKFERGGDGAARAHVAVDDEHTAREAGREDVLGGDGEVVEEAVAGAVRVVRVVRSGILVWDVVGNSWLVGWLVS
jgi:hypothetical protein